MNKQTNKKNKKKQNKTSKKKQWLTLHRKLKIGQREPANGYADTISSKLPSDRLNNLSRSRELRTFLYDVADL